MTEPFTSYFAWMQKTHKKHKIKDTANLSHSLCGTDVLCCVVLMCLVAFQLDEHGKFIKTTLESPVNDSGRFLILDSC